MHAPYKSMIYPSHEDLLDKTDSKFALVILAARRSKEITDYHSSLGHTAGSSVPPQVVSLATKSLSIALEEIAEGKIVGVWDDETIKKEDSEQGQTDINDEQ